MSTRKGKTQLKISVIARQLLPWESNQIGYMQMRTNTFRQRDCPLVRVSKSPLSGTISIVKLLLWKTFFRSVHRALAAMWSTIRLIIHSTSRKEFSVKFPRQVLIRTKGQVTLSTQPKEHSMEPIICHPSALEQWMETNWLLIRRLLRPEILHQDLARNSPQSQGHSTLSKTWYSTIHPPKSSTI